MELHVKYWKLVTPNNFLRSWSKNKHHQDLTFILYISILISLKRPCFDFYDCKFVGSHFPIVHASFRIKQSLQRRCLHMTFTVVFFQNPLLVRSVRTYFDKGSHEQHQKTILSPNNLILVTCVANCLYCFTPFFSELSRVEKSVVRSLLGLETKSVCTYVSLIVLLKRYIFKLTTL